MLPALQQALETLRQERDDLVDSCILKDAAGQPDLTSIEDIDRAAIEEFDMIVAATEPAVKAAEAMLVAMQKVEKALSASAWLADPDTGPDAALALEEVRKALALAGVPA